MQLPINILLLFLAAAFAASIIYFLHRRRFFIVITILCTLVVLTVGYYFFVQSSLPVGSEKEAIQYAKKQGFFGEYASIDSKGVWMVTKNLPLPDSEYSCIEFTSDGEIIKKGFCGSAFR